MGLEKTTLKPVNIVIAVLIIILGGFLYTRLLYSNSEIRIMNTLKESSGLNVQIMQKETEKEKKIISNLALLLGQSKIFEVHDVVDSLSIVAEQNSFKRMGIILPSGTAYTTDGLVMELGERDFFKEAMDGKNSISDTLKDKAGGGDIIVYSSPILRNGKVSYVLFATYSTDWYSKSLSAVTFEGAGYTCVVKSNGDSIVHALHPQGLGGFSNLFESLLNRSSINNQAVESLQLAMSERNQGMLEFLGPVKSRMYYRPLDINDWYLLTIVPAEVIHNDINRNLIQSYLFVIFSAAAFILLIFQLKKIQDINRKKVEAIAFVDNITGGATYEKFKINTKELRLKNFGVSYSIVCLNIEKFKFINELYGYEEGNRALRFIWNTIHDQINRNETFTRRSADQFAILMTSQDETDLAARITDLYESICSQHIFSGKCYRLKPSIGIYQMKPEEQDLEYMIDRANIALNSIKFDVFQFYAFYDKELDEEMRRHKLLEDNFYGAINNQEFIVFYQPKFNLLTHCFEGSEALVRWQLPNHGLISPGFFIPLFEKNGYILTLDQYVFTAVCRDIRRWIDAGLHVTPVSINLSRLHLYQNSFIEEYVAIIKQFKIPPELIQLELTETVFFDSEDVLTNILSRLRVLGIKILMDDFGSGYSSINMLKNIPVDILKLDKALIDGSEYSYNGQMILKHTIELSHELGLKVVAEGAETKEQFDILDNLGCDYIQGYYCAKPMDKHSYEELLNG